MKKILPFLLISLISFSSLGQEKVTDEVAPPYNIKTISFFQNNVVSYPFFKLGDAFEIQFDDLYGNEADYYYTITQYDFDWTPTGLAKVEYLEGMDNQRIITYENSFNTLQLYSHYKQTFPNRFNRITKSGNYIITILNDDREVVFSKKFIIYENIANVSTLVRKSRDIETINQIHNLDFSINLGDNTLQNPKQNIKVSLFQNARWDTAKHGIAPQYTIGNELIYRYNKETQFWAGNEFLNFDNSTIRAGNNTVMQFTAGDIYNTILFTNQERKDKLYTFFPDLNGSFFVNNRDVENPTLQADYTWVYFSLDASSYDTNDAIYINGLFNGYAKNDEYKMEFSKEKGYFEKAVLIKQGFVNFEYTLTDKKGNVDCENAIDGNFYQTENVYNVLVYYRGNNDRYDRVIGNGSTDSTTIKN